MERERERERERGGGGKKLKTDTKTGKEEDNPSKSAKKINRRPGGTSPCQLVHFPQTCTETPVTPTTPHCSLVHCIDRI